MIGSISPDSFATVVQMMEECDEKGVDLVFFVGENSKGGKAAAYLSATVGRPKEERETPKRTAWSARTTGTSGSTSAPSTKSKFGDGLKSGGKNPPKDPLEKYLEDEETES